MPVLVQRTMAAIGAAGKKSDNILVVVQLQANIIAPRVMGTAVRLRPAVVLIGLLVGFQVGGLLGSLLAVPIIASIRDVAVYIWRKLIDKDPWTGEDEAVIASEP